MKTREDLKKELKTFSRDELIEAIMISPMVTGFVLTKCKSKKSKINKADENSKCPNQS